ncbi:MAG TPA: serine hydrolase domain-containing protein [Blastocatellia bacterium]|nr:serine hydrolase domain-containing protein [Blastocatellia bacterium]
MTKPVTGVAAMMLVEGGRIALDQAVAEVVPEFRSLRVATDIEKGLSGRPATKTMTMRHLLMHTSGLSYWTPLSGARALPTAYRERGITPGNYGTRLNRPGYGPQVRNLTEMVERVAELPLLCEPGTAYNYSIGLDVMGLVIERVTGKGFDRFLRRASSIRAGTDSALARAWCLMGATDVSARWAVLAGAALPAQSGGSTPRAGETWYL